MKDLLFFSITLVFIFSCIFSLFFAIVMLIESQQEIKELNQIIWELTNVNNY